MADTEEEERTESIHEEEEEEEEESVEEVQEYNVGGPEEEECFGEEKVKPEKKRRCQRKKKIRQICYDYEDEEDEKEVVGIFHEDEESEDEESEEEESEEEESEEGESESDVVSTGTSVLSAISFVWENEVYEFEELCDPGNIETIYKRYRPEPEKFDETGLNRYLKICQSLIITPMLSVLHTLRTNEMDLSYQNINSSNIRAMCGALEINSVVEKLIMKYDKLKVEDCYYIGLVLYYNDTISHLDFTGCRVGPAGLEKLIAYLPKNESIVHLNLSKCNIQDEGMKYLAYVIMQNNSIQSLDLSYNKLESEAAEALGMAFRLNTSITDLNLRYNNLFDPVSMKGFFRALAINDSVSRLDLSWNGLNGVDMSNHIGTYLKKSGSIKYLDLSDNRFEGMAVIEIKKGLSRSKSLETLKLGKNPMSPEDSEAILAGAKGCSSLLELDLEDLWVNKPFVKALRKIQQNREIRVNFAGMFSNYEVFGPDYPKIILQRAQFEATKPKKPKKRKDFGHLVWTLGDEPITQDDFMTKVKKFKAKINKELFPELMKQFLIPKVQLIDVVAMRRKYLSIFPDSTPPPPPKTKGKKGQLAAQEAAAELKDEEETQEPPTEILNENSEQFLEDAIGSDKEEEEELVLEGTKESEEEVNPEGSENYEDTEEGEDEERGSVTEEA